jgi:phosphonate transport system permease protein
VSQAIARSASPFSRPRGGRRAALVGILLAGLLAFQTLGLDLQDLIPDRGGLTVMGEFFSHALRPALTYEADFVPEGTKPLLLKALVSVGTTFVFAAASLGLALIFGSVLGFFASSAWWVGDASEGHHPLIRWARRSVFPFVYGSARVLIALMRSIHELLWATLFLAAFGLSEVTAVLAIAIPYGGTLAKVFSEIIDEAPRDTAVALKSLGAAPLQIFFFGLVLRVAPDLLTYLFYRLECAVRASAIMGFFGYPTLGYYLAASFENLHYGEVWTYLYALIAMVVVLDWWSSAFRRSLAQ